MPSSCWLVACIAWRAQDTASSRGPVALFVLSKQCCVHEVSVVTGPHGFVTVGRSGDGTYAGAMQFMNPTGARGPLNRDTRLPDFGTVDSYSSEYHESQTDRSAK
ncbi:hypothetical protein CLCR_09321 [Cladophialophora carrionii]|uniref:Uncharacterized protein n=1 Tax=Cladophialophora carrionii TaxID=86049 RepID=A0A1C1CUQ2_9EURO|nr:hypothetical protein CLCR_09321 [Cladophialophora carrionii]